LSQQSETNALTLINAWPTTGELSPGARLQIPEIARAAAAELSRNAGAWLKASTFDLYFAKKSASTKRSRYADVATFTTFLTAAGIDVQKEDFTSYAEYWSIVDHNIVRAFVLWMIAQGFAMETINRKLSSIKVFCELAAAAGSIDGAALALIQSVHGHRGAEAVRIDEQRDQTRHSDKKEQSTLLTQDQARRLMAQPDTPQGRRDLLLITLLLEHGLRVSELALLEIENIADNEMRFYRPKLAGYTQEYGHHILTNPTREALAHWADHQLGNKLLRSSRKGGHLTTPGMSTRAITARVRTLGETIGIYKLSAHDCRHYCATTMAERNYSIRELMDWFGWTSAQTAMRYVEGSKKQERYKG